MPAITWSIKEIGSRVNVAAAIEDRPCPQEVKDAVREILSHYPENAQVFVDTGGRLDTEYATFNLRIEVNKNKKQ